MYEGRFSVWRQWHQRNSLAGLASPGVYAIAHTPDAIAASPFTWREDIIYVGMTNSAAGLKGRLKQFDNTIIGKTGHGGADRVRYKHRDYGVLCERLFVATVAFACDVRSNSPTDLRIMGDVAQFEFLCFAHFVETFGRMPEFNNKKDTKKWSLTVGRQQAG